MAFMMNNVSYSIRQGGQYMPILKNINLSAAAGEFVSIIGKSGTGKSTLLKLACGLEKPDEGEITIQNEPSVPGAAGYMPQKDLLLPWRTVMDNLLLSPEVQKKKKEKRKEAEALLERVGLSAYEKAYPHELSGGMRQRIAFLRTLLTGKEVLFLDEPFGALDAMTKKDMHQWMAALWRELDKTIVLVTHDLHESVFLSDRIIVLHPSGETEEITVPLPRPRETFLTPEITELINTLESSIRHESYQSIS
ncbi:putative hydroxymethylpyrimidine transport system ATP-binding protein [Fictibacillus solisalsi]|uniref:Putative hydroxymethylpyrimidine transport system ATP-binding protein n=1 Tax=Fictibacillus solisalsi TaxID=459525 RepID=A0A1G9TAG2_9BACL|nr:ABC transporter ATP-binding protein [Fictibacillus solisalsi]SDM44608.1 putative hydroxymethylpyrimidine transport system ATP-binding protein [Fictibacillus solisalsi]